MRNDHIDAELDQLNSKLGGTIASPVGIAEFKRNVLPFHVAKWAQASSKGISEWMWRRSGNQYADARQFSRLLSARRERPRRRSAAEKGDETAPLDRVSRHLFPHEREMTFKATSTNYHSSTRPCVNWIMSG